MVCRLNVSTQQITANQHCYVINDLAEVDCFKDRPYVSGWPFARFYAEVPLKSGGFVIGSVCVGDNKPRSGMDVVALDKLTEVATAVAIHLDLVQAQNRLRRSQEMVRGLGQFVDGKVGLGNNPPLFPSSPWTFPGYNVLILL
jgi:GAF domain-containing protein